jgi:pimeloyl-ACP methyl ester carboxylesterase
MIATTPDQRAVYYQTTGSGPEVLLVHGGLPAYFDELVDVLSPHYRCIAFDRLGFRRSARLSRNTTVGEQVMAIAAVHRCVTTAPAWVFGYSSGGNFALAYALSHPDRVRGLLLVEPALYAIYPPEQTPPAVERMQNVAMPLFQQGQLEQGWQAFGAAVFPSWSWPPLSEEGLDMVRSFGYDQPVVITWCPSPAELQRLTLPVLILGGDQSPSLLRDICQRLQRQLNNVRLVTLPGQDHGMPFAAPKLVAEQSVAFISEGEGNSVA